MSRQVCGISFPRGKKFRKFSPRGFDLEEEKATHEQWREELLIDDFNTACNNIDSSSLKVGGESMVVINFRTTEKGKLPPLSYISARRSHQEGISIQLTVLLQGLVIPWVP